MSGSKQFTRVSNNHPDHNLFDLSHSLKCDMDFGYIYPVLVKQCVPGDVVRLGVKNVTRMNPAIVPFSHTVDVNYYGFFVPYRILDWSQLPGLFESVISGGIDGTESRDFPRFAMSYTDDSSYLSGYIESGSPASFPNSITNSPYGYIRNIYPLDTLLSNNSLTYYPSNDSSATTSFHFYPKSNSDTEAYLEPSYVFPNPQGITDVPSTSSDTDFLDTYHKLAFGLNSLCDYMGVIPPQAFGFDDSSDTYVENTSGILSQVLAYPWYAYNRIYIDYFADENLESAIFKDPSGVQDNGNFFVHGNSLLMRCNWEKDYFSSALPWQQRGTAPAISVSSVSNFSPLTVAPSSYSDASSDYDSVSKDYSASNNAFSITAGPLEVSVPAQTFAWVFASLRDPDTYPPELYPTQFSDLIYNSNDTAQSATWSLTNSVASQSDGTAGTAYASVGYYSPVGVNLDGLAGSFDIAQLRNALSVQHFMERNARSGVRYTEFLRSHFGVSPNDSRLQRAEYLGGTKTNLLVSEVYQTAPSSSDSSVVGDYAGKGIIAMEDGNVINGYHVDEFGCIMVVCTIRPKPAYFQGVPREWLYGDRYSWFFPEFQNLSEQAIMNEELYLDDATTISSAQGIFGYQGIYDELRTCSDRVAGELRDTLDFWHLARKFDDMPSLSYDFIKVMPYSDDLHRVFAYEGSDSSPVNPFIMTHVFQLSFLRPLTFMPNPGVAYV